MGPFDSNQVSNQRNLKAINVQKIKERRMNKFFDI